MNTQEEIKIIKTELIFSRIIVLILLGVLLNIAVMINNGSKMPIYYSESEAITSDSSTYIPFTDMDEVNYPYLSDIITIGRVKFSLGDFIMFSGLALLIIFAFKYVRGRK